jgi:membrane-associated phospholipid phosphatase
MRAVGFGAVLVAVASGGALAEVPCPVNRLDCVAISQFSATADAASDATFITALTVPLALELGRGLDDDSPRRIGAHAGAVAATGLAAFVVKLAVRRPRPYTHRREPTVVAYARGAGDRERSFFSGHTSLAFASLVAGAALYQPLADDDRARIGVWTAAGFLGSVTGGLRIRAGRHYPTDVLTGAVIGTGIAIAATELAVADARVGWRDLAGFGAGIVVGGVAAALVPLPTDVTQPVAPRGLAWAPLVAPRFAGLSIRGLL